MPRAAREAGGLALAALLIWLVFERSGLDHAVSRAVFDPARGVFSLRYDWWLAVPGHTGLKNTMLAVWLGILLGGVLPVPACSAWRPVLREAALRMALAAAAVALAREASRHSCPWDLVEFGGTAQWFGLLAELPANPGPGRCLPAAHASSGFALFGLYFALRAHRPGLARIALAAACALGTLAGAVQVLRGAHFVSHALWSGWIAWAVNQLWSWARPAPAAALSAALRR